MTHFSILTHDSGGLGYNEKVRRKCEELYSAGCRTNHLLACIIDICQERPIEEESADSIFHINNAMKVFYPFIYIHFHVLLVLLIFSFNCSYVKNCRKNTIK